MTARRLALAAVMWMTAALPLVAGVPERRPPPPRQPRDPGNPTKPCPASKPLGGHVELRTDRQTMGYARTMRTDFWFGLAPAALPLATAKPKWPLVLLGSWKGAELVWSRETTSCADRPDPYNEVCRCPSKRARGRTAVDPTIGIIYYPPKPSLSISLPEEIRDSTDVELVCQGPSSGSRGTETSDLPTSIELAPPGEPEPEFFIAAGACSAEPPPPECTKRPDLYVDLATSGTDEYTSQSPGSPEKVTVRLRWEICCGCGEPPKGPEPEFEPCGDPAAQRGLLDVAIANAQRLRDELRPHYESFQQHYRAATQLRPKFQAYVAACASWDIAQTVASGLVEDAPKFVSDVLGILDQVLDQDPAVILSTGALFELEGFGDANDAWSLLTTLAGAAKDISNAGSVEGMRGKLEECSGTPTVDDKLYNDAKAYIDEVEKALAEVPEMGRLKTMVEQADADVVNKYAKWYAACVEYAQCRGTDPADCGPAPK